MQERLSQARTDTWQSLVKHPVHSVGAMGFVALMHGAYAPFILTKEQLAAKAFMVYI